MAEPLPTRALMGLRHEGIKTASAARKQGFARIARIPGVGEKALRILFPEAYADRSRLFTPEEIALVRGWYHALDGSRMLTDADHALAAKIGARASHNEKKPPTEAGSQ